MIPDPRCATCDCQPHEHCRNFVQSERDYRQMVAKRPRVLPQDVPEFTRTERRKKR